jgi:hypothetical protein
MGRSAADLARLGASESCPWAADCLRARSGGARAVRLLIRGRWHGAVPTVISDQDGKAGVLAEFARRNGPRAARGLMLGLSGDRQPTRDELLAAAAKTTITRFALSGRDDT